MTTERIPGGWITCSNWSMNDGWVKAAFDRHPTPADRTDAWWRMNMALWSQSFPPCRAMSLIGVDLAPVTPWPTAERQTEMLAEDIGAIVNEMSDGPKD